MKRSTAALGVVLCLASLACHGSDPTTPKATRPPAIKVEIGDSWRAVGTVAPQPEYYGFQAGKVARAVRLTARGQLQLTDAHTGKQLSTLAPRTLPPLIVEFSADATRLALALPNGTIRLHDAADGRLIKELGKTENIRDLRLSADGDVLAGVTGNGVLLIWDGRNGGLRHEVQTPERHGFDVGLSPDGTRVVVSGRPHQLVDAASGKFVADLHDTYAKPDNYTFSPDGTRFIGTHARGAAIWRARDGKLLRTLQDVPTKGTYGVYTGDLYWSPSGRLVLALWGLANIFSVHEAKTGKRIAVGEIGSLDGFAFSPNEDSVAIHRLGELHWIGLPGGEELATAKFDIVGVTFRPDGQLVVLAGARGVTGEGRGRKFETVELSSLELSPRVDGLRRSADGKTLVANERSHNLGRSFGPPRILDSRTFRPLTPEPADPIGGVAFNSDGTRVVTGGRRVQIWTTEELEPRVKCPRAGPSLHYQATHSVALLEDGRTILASDSEQLRVFEVSRKGCRLRETLEAAGYSHASLLASLRPEASDALLVLRDPKTRREVLRTVRGDPGGETYTRWFKHVAISASGRQVLHADNLEYLRSFSVKGPSWESGNPETEGEDVLVARWSPDDRYVVVLGEGGQLVRIDAQSGDRKLITRIGSRIRMPFDSGLTLDGNYAIVRREDEAFLVATDRVDAKVRHLGSVDAVALHAGRNRLAIATTTEPRCSGGDHCHLDNVVHMLDLDDFVIRSTTSIPLSEIEELEFDPSGDQLAVVGDGLHLLKAP